jgi:hypothetical protein
VGGPGPVGADGGTDTPDALAATVKPAELEQLAELVYRLLRQDVIGNRERRGETPARWR